MNNEENEINYIYSLNLVDEYGVIRVAAYTPLESVAHSWNKKSSGHSAVLIDSSMMIDCF